MKRSHALKNTTTGNMNIKLCCVETLKYCDGKILPGLILALRDNTCLEIKPTSS